MPVLGFLTELPKALSPVWKARWVVSTCPVGDSLAGVIGHLHRERWRAAPKWAGVAWEDPTVLKQTSLSGQFHTIAKLSGSSCPHSKHLQHFIPQRILECPRSRGQAVPELFAIWMHRSGHPTRPAPSPSPGSRAFSLQQYRVPDSTLAVWETNCLACD